MSVLIDTIKNHTVATPAPLGFRNAPVAEKPRLLLIAEVVPASSINLAACVEGADAGVMEMTDLKTGLEGLANLARNVPGIPWGGRIRNPGLEKAGIAKTEADFLVFPPEAPAVPLPASLGRVLEISEKLPDSYLRALDDLPIDALWINEPLNESITWQCLVQLQRLENICARPLILTVHPSFRGSDLETLWRVGVDGVVIKVDSEREALMRELKQVVVKGNFPLPRKSRKMDVLLPIINRDPAASLEEEEEEE